MNWLRSEAIIVGSGHKWPQSQDCPIHASAYAPPGIGLPKRRASATQSAHADDATDEDTTCSHQGAAVIESSPHRAK